MKSVKVIFSLVLLVASVAGCAEESVYVSTVGGGSYVVERDLSEAGQYEVSASFLVVDEPNSRCDDPAGPSVRISKNPPEPYRSPTEWPIESEGGVGLVEAWSVLETEGPSVMRFPARGDSCMEASENGDGRARVCEVSGWCGSLAEAEERGLVSCFSDSRRVSCAGARPSLSIRRL
jgi:hypothetical protein